MADDTSKRRNALKALAALGLAIGDARGETRPGAQDAVKVDPRSYKVLVENAEVRVVEHLSRPRMGVCGTGMHSHPDHVTVCLTAAKAHVKLPDGTTATVENKAGDTWFEPAVTHSVENVGGGDVHVYLVELKTKA